VTTIPNSASPVTIGTRVSVGSNQRAEVEFYPNQSGTTFHLPIVAVTRAEKSTYQVDADGTVRYEQSPLPPSEPNHLEQAFMPPLEFGDSMKVTIRNVDTASREYSIMVVGWEI
jgi:hypothetical protein